MRLKRWISLALAAVLALAVAGIAVAHKGHKSGPTEPAQATFTATPDADRSKTRDCTGADGTYTVSKTVFRGTSTSSDPRLNGNLLIRDRSWVNTTSGLGYSKGKVYLRNAETGKLMTVAGYDSVITEGNKFDGFALGHSKSPGVRHSRLAANFTAAFDGATLTGEIGQGTGQNSAIFFGGPCKREKKAGDEGERGGDREAGDRRREGRRGGRGGRKGDDDR